MGYAYGYGFGHTWRGKRRTVYGGAGLLANELNGFATDFTYSVDAQRVAVKTAGAVVSQGLDSFYTNAGTSPKQVYDAAGTLSWSPHNTVLQSQTFDNASWTKTLCTVGANAVVAPDGTTTADAVIPNAGSNIPLVQNAALSVIATAPYTHSVYVKNGTLGNNWFILDTASSATFRGWFNLATGVKGTSTGSPTSYNITAVGSGWYRVDITFPAGGSTAAQCSLRAVSADGSAGAITGDGTSPAFYAWGAQLNRGTVPTAYTSTTTAARYGLAIDYDPVTHAPKGLLCEPAATNLILNNAAMPTQSVTVTAVAYTLSFWGTGTVTLSGVSTAGPLVGTGAADRVSLTFTPTAGSLTCTVTGTVSNAQLETGTAATSPIPTFAASATRAADNYTFLLSTIPTLGSAYSMYGRFSTPLNNSARYAYVVTDGVNNWVGPRAVTQFSHMVSVAGSLDANIPLGSLIANVPLSGAIRVQLNNVGASVAGSAVTTDTLVAVPTTTEMRFGNAGNSAGTVSVFNICKIMLVPRAWSDAELPVKSAIT